MEANVSLARCLTTRNNGCGGVNRTALMQKTPWVLLECEVMWGRIERAGARVSTSESRDSSPSSSPTLAARVSVENSLVVRGPDRRPCARGRKLLMSAFISSSAPSPGAQDEEKTEAPSPGFKEPRAPVQMQAANKSPEPRCTSPEPRCKYMLKT